MKDLNFHKSFQLNGISFSSEDELLTFSKTINDSIYQFLSDWFNTNDFVIVQTSGSTGKPKPISLKKEFMINSAKATGAFFNLEKNTTALLCLSTDYIAGKMMLVRALTLGWSIDVVAPTSKVEIVKNYDFSAMVPLQLRSSLESIHKIKKLIVGGGVVANDLIKIIEDKSTEIFATYGMTETITHIAVKKLNNVISNDSEKSHYKALPNVQLSQDNRNCLIIDASKVSEEKVVTNDVVRLISKTEFEWLGRYDNVINSGGVKLHPEKIEEKLSKVIPNRFFVTGIPDQKLGEKLILLVEGEINNVISNEVRNLLGLTKYEIPKEIYFVDKFIETETKKIQRKKTLDLVEL
ncbi:AMP-binding protein [Tenacibaculum larymnensis]|uniref:AMP-binding protein n=1 Tax=Tenacibaculum larymnensis TaxID=2878201 RepID=A0A9X4ESQ3_9FLAO|nr:AMP-binding protein [Tenacibaculum larymnensis]MDE1207540.1 AMP-binding protein [Tenacibaculum larymnensis]